MRLNDVATLTVSDQSALASNDRPVQLKLALESNAVLMPPSGSDDHFNRVLTQHSHGGRILFADCFIRTKKCAVQVNRSQFKRELRCKLIVVSRSAHREELKLCFSPKISSTLMKSIVRRPCVELLAAPWCCKRRPSRNPWGCRQRPSVSRNQAGSLA